VIGQVRARLATRGVMRAGMAVATVLLAVTVSQGRLGAAVLMLAALVLAAWGDLVVGRGTLVAMLRDLGRDQRDAAARHEERLERIRLEADARWALSGVMHRGRPWPQPGGWALDAEALMSWVRELDRHECRTLVELGPGMSTVVVGHAMPHLQIVAVEHSEHYADKLRADLSAEGLDDVTVVHAPLREGEAGTWYDPDVMATLPASIDAILVDGPPNWRGQGRRRPAEGLIRERLRPGGVVLVDDTARPDERAMVEEWVASGVCEVVRDAGSFIVLRRREGSPG
jgi:predicted O-methyltransferase YrrM